MDKEILEQIKNEYNELYKISIGDFEEIKELEQNPLVQRYKYLLDLKASFDRVDNYYKKSYIFEKIINKYGNGKIDVTNNLWFWFFDVSISQYEKIFNTVLEETDKNKIVSVYFNLENSKKVIVIPVEEQNTFEIANKVIRGNRAIFNAYDRYFNTRYEYFNLCINEGQEEALKAMLYEEECRLLETKNVKDKELENLDTYLNYNLITREEYDKRRQLVLLKK